MERAAGDLNDSWPSDGIYFRVRDKAGAFIPRGGLDPATIDFLLSARREGFDSLKSVKLCVMENEQQVRTLILRVLNVAETGHPDGKPHAVYIYADGKNGRKQVTLAVGFTEDGGSMGWKLRRGQTQLPFQPL